MEINDECCCGARFAVAGGWADCASVHRDWLSAHKACREATTLHVDNGNEADREGTFDLPEIDDGWIRHDGGACPVHPMDMVVWYSPEWHQSVYGKSIPQPGWMPPWNYVARYYPLRDSNGVPYCSAEGLEFWAEYVATDSDGSAHQMVGPLKRMRAVWMPDGYTHLAPAHFANTRVHWTQTLRRVYRREDA